MHLKEELEQRGYLHQRTHDEVFDLFDAGGKKFYLGVDLSADSMTIGNFVALMMAIRIMLKGNTGYLLVGGATSTIGNPSGKDNERPILSDEQLVHNQEAIHQQFASLCSNIEQMANKKLEYTIVNNKDFFSSMNVLDYLKEVGRHITVNRMLGKDIVRKRVNDPDKRISYAEFSYMLIMGYDFYHLFTHDDVIMEVGGSDEWDGIITGIELIGKKTGKTAYGITNKLILDSTGKKFGKSEGNALWLDPMKNSPYTVYQYFINTADADVERYLKLFTLLSFEDIEEIVTQHAADPAARYGQQRLAYLVTQIIFGTDAAEASVLATAFAFAKDEQKKELLEAADPGYIQMLCTQLGAGSCARGTSFLAAIADPEHGCALVSSRGEGKKLMKSGALWLNGKKITDPGYLLENSDAHWHGVARVKKGKSMTLIQIS